MSSAAVQNLGEHSRARFRELTGREELFQYELSSMGANELLRQLLPSGPLTPPSDGGWRALTLHQRDHLIADLYTECFGDQIEARVPCDRCGEMNSLSFSLAEFRADCLCQLEGHEKAAFEQADRDGFWNVEGGRIRLPRIGDEVAQVEGSTSLFDACVQIEDPECPDCVIALLERAGPSVSGVIESSCTSCEAPQSLFFDICEFFLGALQKEQPILLREAHCLARNYGWGLEEILALSRSQRRELVALVAAELAQSRGAA